jgi:cysteine desulfurase
MQRIYLDHNATTPPAAEALAEQAACQTEAFGNPSSLHWAGQDARLRLDRARQQVAALLGAQPEEIVFTSGATEADNLVLQGLAAAHPGGHIVTTAIEHQGVLATCRQLEARGIRVTRVRPGADGVVTPEAVVAALTADTFLVSVMLANNDTGVLQPVRPIAILARARGIAVHTDATQAVGKIPVDVRELGVDYLTLSAHKLRGPKGAGALFCRDGRAPIPQILGGGQESGHRAGTENLPALAGFGRACALAQATLAAEAVRVGDLRDRLEAGLHAHFPGVRRNGHPEQRLPNTLNVSFPGVAALPLVLNLDLLGIAVSAGSACSSGSTEPSHVLLAMGQSPEDARRGVRFSLGATTTAAEVDAALAALAQVLPRLQPRRAAPTVPPPP